MDPRSVASPGLVSAFMQKKRHDLLRDHDQMGKHDCYWRAKVRKTTWVPDQDPALRLREFLPSIKIGPRDDRFSAEMPSGELFGAFCDRGTRNPKPKKVQTGRCES